MGDSKNMIEYVIALISDFAKYFKISEAQAYKYLKFHDGISYVLGNYGILHTLSFSEAIESLSLFCKKSGGELYD